MRNIIVIWACNSISTNLHHWPFVLEAQKRGAKVVVIDSYRSRTAKAGDWHICPKPGTDGALAMGFINSMIEQGLVDRDYVEKHTYGFEELKARAAEFTPDYVEKVTGVKAPDIAKFAREFATTQPSVIRLGVALERHAGGGQAIRAVCALPALVGSWRHVGGGLLQMPLWEFPVDWMKVSRGDWIKPGTRAINNLQLGRGADRRHEARSADQEPVRLLHQSGEPGAGDQQDRQGAAARGPVHRRRRAFPHRHGEIRRHRAARRHGRRGRGHDVVLGAFLFHL